MSARVHKPSDAAKISTRLPFQRVTREGKVVEEAPPKKCPGQEPPPGDIRQMPLAIGYCFLKSFSDIVMRMRDLPETFTECLSDYLGAVEEIVTGDGGGTIKFKEGGIVYFYGHYPRKTDPAIQTVLAALKIRYRMNKLNRGWEYFRDESWKVGFGITTGTVEIEGRGKPGDVEWDVRGASVDQAIRIGKSAGSSQILLTDRTFNGEQFDRDYFSVNNVFHIQPKGSDTAIKVREVIGVVKA